MKNENEQFKCHESGDICDISERNEVYKIEDNKKVKYFVSDYHIDMEYFECSFSNEYFHEDDLTETAEDGTVNDIDLKEEYTECSDCGEYYKNDELKDTHNTSDVCQSCLDESYMYSEIEDTYIHENDAITVYSMSRNYQVVEDIAHEDNSSYVYTQDGEYWHEHDAYSVNDGEYYISRQDYDNGEYFTCDSCNDVYDYDQSHNIEDMETVCDSCFNSNYSHYEYCDDNCYYTADSVNSLHNYNYKPSPIFKGKSKIDRPFLGVELEIETKENNSPSEIAQENLHDNYYYKNDSSLDNGLELVTHPMTLDMHKEHDYKSLFESIVKMGGRSHNTSTCGMHVHIDKTKMNEGHQIRLGLFFAICKNYIEKISRRSNNHYARFKDISNLYNNFNNFNYNHERYEALNWKNFNTVEIRCFKGTLKYETFMARLEFSEAVYNFTRDKHSLNCKHHDFKVFKRFIKFLDRNDYKFLNDYLIELGIKENNNIETISA